MATSSSPAGSSEAARTDRECATKAVDVPPREANYPPWMNGSSGEQTVENAAGSPISGHKIPETDTINVTPVESCNARPEASGTIGLDGQQSKRAEIGKKRKDDNWKLSRGAYIFITFGLVLLLSAISAIIVNSSMDDWCIIPFSGASFSSGHQCYLLLGFKQLLLDTVSNIMRVFPCISFGFGGIPCWLVSR